MAKTTEMVEVAVGLLKPYERNAKKHPQEQIDKIKDSIKEFGFISPCLIDKENRIIAGHGRVQAATQLGFETVPCVYIEGLTEEQRQAYIIADNRLTELGGWDEELVKEELLQLNESGFNVALTGFTLDEFVDNIDGFDEPDDNIEQLPDSHVFICGVSAFGTQSDTVLVAKLQQEAADHLLEVLQQEGTAAITARIVEAINAL